jgi:3-deoxy-D-manno-octulosonic-acid transferase
MTMALYSLLLGCVLGLGSPYWLWRLARGGAGWRSSLMARLGRVPRELRRTVSGRQVVWVHAVSVGEVLAAARLIAELERTLGDEWRIVVSTTTATGQALARERFTDGKEGATAGRVFYYPLDFAWSIKAYLRAIKPKMLILMESELWPRMLVECNRAGVPVAVVNARVSDRSFARGMRVRFLWRHLLSKVNLFLTQSEEDARRLVEMSARAETVRATGNLKYDAAEPKGTEISRRLDSMRGNLRVVIAGSTLDGEEHMLLAAWRGVRRAAPDTLLLIAPRHPQRFPEVLELITASGYVATLGSHLQMQGELAQGSVVLLDTIGDLASTYGLAEIAFVGGSLVPRGGHNPLEPARFGVPVMMGPSYENFCDIVQKMQAADGIRIVSDKAALEHALIEMLMERDTTRTMGKHGQFVFEQQQGATARTVEALVALLSSGDSRDRNATTLPEPKR